MKSANSRGPIGPPPAVRAGSRTYSKNLQTEKPNVMSETAVSDGLSGVYHHLGLKQDFEVAFYRFDLD